MRGLTARRLGALVRRLGGVRVLVVGDLMLDRFVWGRVQRISPEAPVPVLQVTEEEARAGGAGNVVANVAALGGRATVCGIVGNDDAGRCLRALLDELGARTDGVVTARRMPTTEKMRVLTTQQQLVRLDRERVTPLEPATARRLHEAVLGRLRKVDVLVVSDYGKGAVGPELLEAIGAEHARRPFTWVVDPKRANFAHYRGVSLVKPNREEAAAASGVDIVDGASLRRAGARLLSRWQAEAVLISRGDEGMALFRQGGRVHEFPTQAREVYDVTGAGDTVIATCALALGAGSSLEDATMLANHAAGIVVGKRGTATVTAKELAAAVAER